MCGQPRKARIRSCASSLSQRSARAAIETLHVGLLVVPSAEAERLGSGDGTGRGLQHRLGLPAHALVEGARGADLVQEPGAEREVGAEGIPGEEDLPRQPLAHPAQDEGADGGGDEAEPRLGQG